MDNLNTYKRPTLHDTINPTDVRLLAYGFEVHHTPKHGSWLNMAEITINILTDQYLLRSISDREFIVFETKV